MTLAADINNEHVIDTGMQNPITSCVIYSVLLHAKNGRVVSVDGNPIEALRNQTAVKFMLSLFNECYSKGAIPSAWTKSIINPIPKNSGAQSKDPLVYRGIALTSAIYKPFCGVLNNRLKSWANQNNLLCDEQNGFRAGRNCIDHLGTLTNLAEYKIKSKKSLFVAFIDFSKAYDRINRDLLWSKLQLQGLNGHMLNILKAIYNDVRCCARINGTNTDWFQVTSGLKQGCLLSPLLYNMYVNDLVHDLKSVAEGNNMNDEKKINFLLYADGRGP